MGEEGRAMLGGERELEGGHAMDWWRHEPQATSSKIQVKSGLICKLHSHDWHPFPSDIFNSTKQRAEHMQLIRIQIKLRIKKIIYFTIH